MESTNKINKIVNSITKINKTKIKTIEEYNNYIQYMLHGIDFQYTVQFNEDTLKYHYTILIENNTIVKFIIDEKYLKIKYITINNL